MTIDLGGASGGARFAAQISQDGTAWTFEHMIFTNGISAVNGTMYFSEIRRYFQHVRQPDQRRSSQTAFRSGAASRMFDIRENVWENNGAWALNIIVPQGPSLIISSEIRLFLVQHGMKTN
ncbi:MAG: hypothetical protein R3B47_13000 [Bacteroidia bacterium]